MLPDILSLKCVEYPLCTEQSPYTPVGRLFLVRALFDELLGQLGLTEREDVGL